jgi:hypothetical protein
MTAVQHLHYIMRQMKGCWIALFALLAFAQNARAQAPSIGGVMDVTTNVDFPFAMPITITDANPGAVSLFAISSNEAILANSNITFTGSGANRTLRLRTAPVPGRATVTLTATNRDGFIFTINFVVNSISPDPLAPPSIIYVEPFTAIEVQNTIQALLVSDFQPNTVTLRATSLNQVMISDTSIRFEGAGPNRLIIFRSNAQQYGTTIIRVTATNRNGQTFTRDLQVTVIPAPQPEPPIVNPPSIVITTVGQAVTAEFTVTDRDDVNALQFFGQTSNATLIPTSNITFAGAGTNRTVTLTPAPGQTGSSNIIIFANRPDGLTGRGGFRFIVLPANGLPLLGLINNLQTNVNTPVTTNFEVIDQNIAGVTLSASSSNPTLIPNDNIVFGGTGFNRSVSIIPAPGQTGTAVITVTARNAIGAATTTFLVTVAGPPIISPIDAIRTARNTPASVNFTLQDANVNTLRVVAASSNQGLLPNANISITGTGNARTLRITPALNQIGQATVTITVTNEAGLSANVDVPVTVSPPSNPPTIGTINNVTTAVNTPAVVGFTIGDANPNGVTFSATSSNPALIPSSNIFFTGTGSNRVLLLVPLPNQTGSSLITITATNQDGLSTSTSFLFTVAPPPVAPTIQPVLALITRRNTPVSAQFLVSDRDLTTLTFSVMSSNPSVIPPQNVTVSGFGTSRTVLITPAPNVTGQSTIMLTVTNRDGLMATSTFTVTVIAPPTIGTIPTLCIPRNGFATQQFSVTDDNPTTLTFTIGSSNPALVPISSVFVSSASGVGGAQRVLSVAPTLNQVGQSVLTLTATNSFNLSTTVAFLANVLSPPQLDSIMDMTTFANIPVTTDITVNDDNVNALRFTAASANPALIPPANVVVSGSGNLRELTVTPATNQLGTTTVTLTVSNGGCPTVQVSRSFRVTVLPPPRTVPLPSCNSNGTVTLVPNGVDVSSITFCWLEVTGVPGPIFYELQVTPDSTFNFVQFNTKFIQGSTATLNGFDADRVYHWRVRAQFGPTSFSPWSDVYTIRTRRLPPDSVIIGGGFFGGKRASPAGEQTSSASASQQQRGVAATMNAIANAVVSADGRVRLFPNAPNPFSESTRIEYELTEQTSVRLYVLDGLGRRVADLVNTHVRGGRHSVVFHSHGLPSGSYTCVLETPTVTLRGQMVVNR